MKALNDRVAKAVERFWRTRRQQVSLQGRTTGRRDQGNRAAATGGKQLDGFVDLVKELLVDAGIPSAAVFCTGRADVTIPGYFWPSKQWDLLVIANSALLAAVECKSLCGPSFGNNYNNRVEEALGSATDLWTAYRESVFQKTPRPFLGYLLLVEEADKSTRPVGVLEKHFDELPEFRDASYIERCAQSVDRLVRERCYDAACLIASSAVQGPKGAYREPARDHPFRAFARELCASVAAKYKSISVD
ncbi:MAG: PaeR7I family type II restriction endonuclease [Phycisphaerae bacterium]